MFSQYPNPFLSPVIINQYVSPFLSTQILSPIMPQQQMGILVQMFPVPSIPLEVHFKLSLKIEN